MGFERLNPDANRPAKNKKALIIIIIILNILLKQNTPVE